jgi:hypothetical protein
MRSPRRGAPGRQPSGRQASRVAAVVGFPSDVDSDAKRFKIKVYKAVASIVFLAIIAFFSRYIRNGGYSICAKICSLRVSAYDEVSFAIELVFYGIAYTVGVTGLWNNIGQSDPVELFCVVLPLMTCTYFTGLPALALRSEIFYVQSQSPRNRICKSTLVSWLAAFVYCYGQEHEVVLHGKTYVEERLPGIAMMPLIIVLPAMPLVLAMFESHHEKMEDREDRTRRTRTLAITYP